MWRKILTGVVVVGLLGFWAGTAQAERVMIAHPQTVSIPELSDVQIVVTGVPSAGTWSFSACTQDFGFDGDQAIATVVVVDPAAQPVGFRVFATFNIPLPAGTRLGNLILEGGCSGTSGSFDVLSADVVTPSGGATAFLTAPGGVTLSTGGEAIIKGDSEDDGCAEAVIVQQGGPAVHTTLWSDLPLLAGDRICDFEELWTDDDTGETYYFAYVEW